MRIENYFFVGAVMLCFFIFGGCATTIGNKVPIEETDFEIGKTTKQEVADTLGLPMEIKKNKKTGDEFWGYQGQPSLLALDLPQLSPETATTHHVDVENIMVSDGFEKAVVVYVFNEKAILVDVVKYLGQK